MADESNRDWNDNGKWRKAAKAYLCSHCKALIEPGTHYWEDYEFADDPFHAPRYCPSCVLTPGAHMYGMANPAQYPGTKAVQP